MELITREKARLSGLTRFFTGIPCIHGHISARKVINSSCVQCDNERKRKHHAKNAERLCELARIHYANNREQIILRRKLNQKKPSIRKETNRIRDNSRSEDAKLKKKIYYQKNRDWLLQKQRDWFRDNKHIVNARSSRRRAARKDRIPSWYEELDSFVIREAMELASLRSMATRIEWHVDHMIPMKARKASGLHCAYNMQTIPAYMNLSKGNKLVMTEPGEWIAYL